jgi:hypothetical protein
VAYNEDSVSADSPDGRSNAAMDMDKATVHVPQVGNEDVANALLSEHPDYTANKERWDKFTRLYNSRDVYKYIYQHLREHDEMFAKRVNRGYYLNYVASVVDLFVAYLYHSPITRQPDDKETFELLYKDADRRGTRYPVFIQRVTTHAQISGHCGVLVDMPRVDAPPLTEQERLDKKIHPYLVLFQASQILDWELDLDGNFEWVKLEIDLPQPRSWRQAYDSTTRHFLIYTKDHWEKWTVTIKEGGKPEKAVMVDSGDNPLGEVPLVIVRNEPDLEHPWFGISAVRDISDLNIAILNWCSLMDEEMYERCLNVLCVQTVGNDAQDFVIGSNNVLSYGGENAPEYLTPGETPLKLIMEGIDRVKDEIYRLAKLGGDTGLQKSRQATSGIAYAFEFNTTNQSLGKKAESAEQAEYEIHQLVAKWLKRDFEGNIAYPKEFGVEDFLQDLALLADARATLSSETAIQELEKKVTAKMFAREAQDLRDKIAGEIQSTDPKEPDLLNTSLGFAPEPPIPEGEGPVGGGPQKAL